MHLIPLHLSSGVSHWEPIHVGGQMQIPSRQTPPLKHTTSTHSSTAPQCLFSTTFVFWSFTLGTHPCRWANANSIPTNSTIEAYNVYTLVHSSTMLVFVFGHRVARWATHSINSVSAVMALLTYITNSPEAKWFVCWAI